MVLTSTPITTLCSFLFLVIFYLISKTEWDSTPLSINSPWMHTILTPTAFTSSKVAVHIGCEWLELCCISLIDRCNLWVLIGISVPWYLWLLCLLYLAAVSHLQIFILTISYHQMFLSLSYSCLFRCCHLYLPCCLSCCFLCRRLLRSFLFSFLFQHPLFVISAAGDIHCLLSDWTNH